MPRNISRRQFLKLGFFDLVELTGQAVHTDRNTRDDEVLRPPGAVADGRRFRDACTGCGQCVEACPHGAISLLGPAAGGDENTPCMTPVESPCYWCQDKACISACPEGALSFGMDNTVSPIGTADVDYDACLTTQGILCDDCVVVCPLPGRAMKIRDRKPKVNADYCVGCGLCACHCAASPAAIRIVKCGQGNFMTQS